MTLIEKVKEIFPKEKEEEICAEVIKLSKPLPLSDKFFQIILEKLLDSKNVPETQIKNNIEPMFRKFVKGNKNWILITSSVEKL